ncbi:hypothetical protein [Bosea sp. UC22_33]|uniref:hypothetical protein n=1 Tax=Bosea sp. UC22_33 TaxID=3350165 RepID=UPI00366EA878
MANNHRKKDGDFLVRTGIKVLVRGGIAGIAAGWAAGVAHDPLTPVLAGFAGVAALALVICITGQWMRGGEA